MVKEVVKRKGGPIKKVIRESIMQELTKIVQNGNILGITNQQLADKFIQKHDINIKVHTIGNYLKKVYENIPSDDIKHTQVKLEVMFNKVFRIVQEMVATAQTPQEKKNAVELLLRAMDKFTDFLESFGIKQKVAENINLSADITQKSLSIQIIDDRRDTLPNGTTNEDYQ